MTVLDTRPLVSLSVTATNGSDTVVVTGDVNCGYIGVGTIIAIGSFPLYYAISGTAPDPTGVSIIKLHTPWAEPTITDKMLGFMSYEGLVNATYELNKLLNKFSDERGNTIIYRGSWDLAGQNALPTPNTEVMEMWRIMSAHNINGSAYSEGDLIYFDRYADKWRTMWEAVGTAAKANLQVDLYALSGRDVLRRGDHGIGTTFTAANPLVDLNTTPTQLSSLVGEQVHYVTKTLTILNEYPEVKGTLRGYSSAANPETCWQEFIGISGTAYKRNATSSETWGIFKQVMLHGDIDTDTVFNLLGETVTFNSTPLKVLQESGEGAFYFMQHEAASGMPEVKGTIEGYISDTDNFTNSWQEFTGSSGTKYRRMAISSTEWSTFVQQTNSNDLVKGTFDKGRYEKRPDGTLVYFIKLKLVGAVLGAACTDNAVYPIPFVNVPDVCVTPLYQRASGSQSMIGKLNRNGVYTTISTTSITLHSHSYEVDSTFASNYVEYSVMVSGFWN